MSDENVCSRFEKVVKGDDLNVFNSNPYLSAYHWIALLTKNNDARRVFYDIPGQSVGMSKVTISGATLKWAPFRPGMT